jgi:hypothetical protein
MAPDDVTWPRATLLEARPRYPRKLPRQLPGAAKSNCGLMHCARSVAETLPFTGRVP